MAKTVAEHGVVLQGRINAKRELVITLTPYREPDSSDGQDLDDMINEWGSS